MALKQYKNKITGEIKRSLKALPESDWEVMILPPNQKFMVTANEGMGTSKIKDLEGTLKARARNHSRDVMGDDNIQTNLNMGATDSVAKNLLNSKGLKRRKIDDL